MPYQFSHFTSNLSLVAYLSRPGGRSYHLSPTYRPAKAGLLPTQSTN